VHDQSEITRRRALQMAGAVAGLAAGGARGARAQAQPQMQPRIERLAPELDKIISVDEPIKELASGFGGSLGRGRSGGRRAATSCSPISTTTGA